MSDEDYDDAEAASDLQSMLNLTLDMIDTCTAAVEKWGKSIQLVIAVEECSELINAISSHMTGPAQYDMLQIAKKADFIKSACKQLRKEYGESGILPVEWAEDQPAPPDLIEESVDVEIMINQIKSMFIDQGEEWETQMDAKLSRLKDRIEPALGYIS